MSMSEKNTDTFEIYQVKLGIEYRDYRFESIESLEHFGLKVVFDHYNFVYQDKLREGMQLEDIFYKFNEQRPDDFKGHSLSVSDVVVLNMNGHITAHYVDSFGFKNVPEFIIEREHANQKEFSVLKKLEENKKTVYKKDSHPKNIRKTDVDGR